MDFNICKFLIKFGFLNLFFWCFENIFIDEKLIKNLNDEF